MTDVAIVGLGLHPFGRSPSLSGLEQGALPPELPLPMRVPSLKPWNLLLAEAKMQEMPIHL